jgi:hypothetical protein
LRTNPGVAFSYTLLQRPIKYRTIATLFALCATTV